MTLPEFRPQIAPDVRAGIEQKLGDIERDFGVQILFAIESGSRAWGFPSPDSDYDVRFVYAHPVDWYLSLTPGRNVIELPVSNDLDINGWDIRKALNLLLKPNPVLLEWLSSPIRYRWSEDTCQALIDLAAETGHGTACMHHYLKLGGSQWRRYIQDQDTINYKKYFYVLRPALALRWLRLRPGSPPPMNVQDLLPGLDLEAATVDEIVRLIELKSRMREVGAGQRIALLDRLIGGELASAEASIDNSASWDRDALVSKADTMFRSIIEVTRV